MAVADAYFVTCKVKISIPDTCDHDSDVEDLWSKLLK
jgi:hypothetical protein